MLYILLFLAAVASDQWLKYWTVSHLELGESVPFIPHILQLRRLHNYGAAWSSLSGKTVLLVAFTAVLLTFGVIVIAADVVNPIRLFG